MKGTKCPSAFRQFSSRVVSDAISKINKGVRNVATKAGDRLDFDGGVQVIVTKGGEGDVTHSDGGEGLRVGRRYQDEDSGIEVLVTKPGAITLQCDGRDMQLQELKISQSRRAIAAAI